MRITLRLVVALLLVLAAVALLSAHFQASQQKAEQQEELERRSRILAETLGEAVAPLLERGPSQRLDGQTTLVKPFPISVAFPNAFPDAAPTEAADKDRASLLRDLGIKATYLGVGVERMDYTKGVLERLRAIERFLEKYPRYQGQFAYVQLTAPSRTHIKRYHDFLAEVKAEAERINWKFKAKEWRPIMFLKKHHSHQEILPFYKHADLCLVTSLHDGMNLVAKEFVACRDDEGGVLILSQFAGSANELVDAFVVNPYDLEQLADAIRYALQMDQTETAARMRRMRETVRENNVYRWGGNLITELTRIRLHTQLSAAGQTILS